MIEEFKPDTISPEKKYVCKFNYEYSESSMCNFISNKLGQHPERYEIISLYKNVNNRYELFYKEFED